MSQAKVDKYKEYKANRKEILAKEKRNKKLAKYATWVVMLAIVCGIGAGVGNSAYKGYQRKLAAAPNYVRDEMVVSDLTGILTEDTIVAE